MPGIQLHNQNTRILYLLLPTILSGMVFSLSEAYSCVEPVYRVARGGLEADSKQ